MIEPDRELMNSIKQMLLNAITEFRIALSENCPHKSGFDNCGCVNDICIKNNECPDGRW